MTYPSSSKQFQYGNAVHEVMFLSLPKKKTCVDKSFENSALIESIIVYI